MEPRIITLEEGWSYMETGITKLKRMLEGELELGFDSELYMILYTTIYYMCIQKPPHDYSRQLYDRYREAIEDYCKETVLPSLRDKHGEYMLKELALRSHPTLKEVGLTCFRDLVYNEMKSKATEAVIALIHKEREGEEIDGGLLRNVIDIYVEIGR